ncbi:MAG: ion channel [Pleurocapsa sp.]
MNISGYGDILPISKLAKILANLEGIVGVLYPTIFIARLVSLYERDKL